MSTNTANDSQNNERIRAIAHMNLTTDVRSQLYDIGLMSKEKIEQMVENDPDEFRRYIKTIIDILAPSKSMLKLILHHDYTWLVQQVGNAEFLNNVTAYSKEYGITIDKDPVTREVDLLRRLTFYRMLSGGQSLMNAINSANGFLVTIPRDRKGLLNGLESLRFIKDDIFVDGQRNVSHLIIYLSLILNAKPNTIAKKFMEKGKSTAEYSGREFPLAYGIPTFTHLKNYTIDCKVFKTVIVDEIIDHIANSIKVTGRISNIENKLQRLYDKYDVYGKGRDIYTTKGPYKKENMVKINDQEPQTENEPISSEPEIIKLDTESKNVRYDIESGEWVPITEDLSDIDDGIEIDDSDLSIENAFNGSWEDGVSEETSLVEEEIIEEKEPIKEICINEADIKVDPVIEEDDTPIIADVNITMDPKVKDLISKMPVDRFVDFITKLKELIDEYPELDRLQYSFINDRGLKMDGDFDRVDYVPNKTKSVRPRGHSGGRPKLNDENITYALELYNSGEYSFNEIKELTGVSKSSLYRYNNSNYTKEDEYE